MRKTPIECDLQTYGSMFHDCQICHWCRASPPSNIMKNWANFVKLSTGAWQWHSCIVLTRCKLHASGNLPEFRAFLRAMVESLNRKFAVNVYLGNRRTSPEIPERELPPGGAKAKLKQNRQTRTTPPSLIVSSTIYTRHMKLIIFHSPDGVT